jgi:hypothetical protein
MFIPLGRESTPTLRIKVGTIGCATPFGEPTTRVIVDASVADEVWLAVKRLQGVSLMKKSARDIGEAYLDGTGHIRVGVE